ncbi:MAG: hypothetical protein JO328_14215 [Hyphomicrobiales bacterium]|nr:hypothetical protein [Hyphomicrobiales bacterium]MBV8824648.1 hypothetical protein [Hyphomicrobiales bacterium]
MAAKPSPVDTLKALAKLSPDEGYVRGLLRIIEDRHLGSDYAVAIIGSSLIERALEAAILARFVPLTDKRSKWADIRAWMFSFERKGPLADLGARNRFGLALGLYGESTFLDLEKIRTIRNLFAHSPSLRHFSHSAIAKACERFNVIDHVFRHEPHVRETPKAAYVTACITISGRLKGRLESAQDEDRPLIFPMVDELLP